jgi:hypothetical protein
VLKVGWGHDEALHKTDGLRIWDGHGAEAAATTLAP